MNGYSAPSVFASTPWEGTSPTTYRFVPTRDVLSMMEDRGFDVTKAMQSRSRIPGKRPFARHILRLRHADYLDTTAKVGTEIPEIVLVNSHGGTSSRRPGALRLRRIPPKVQAQIGGQLDFGDRERYRVVGIFTAGGSSAESEVWADYRDVVRNTGRDGSVSCVQLRAADRAA